MVARNMGVQFIVLLQQNLIIVMNPNLFFFCSCYYFCQSKMHTKITYQYTSVAVVVVIDDGHHCHLITVILDDANYFFYISKDDGQRRCVSRFVCHFFLCYYLIQSKCTARKKKVAQKSIKFVWRAFLFGHHSAHVASIALTSSQRKKRSWSQSLSSTVAT